MARARLPSSLAEVGEFGFLRQILPKLPRDSRMVVGPGDDCAVVRSPGSRLLLTTDAVVDGVHFRRAWMTPRQIGRKAYLVNASDVAAMGGRPRFCLISVGAPPDFPSREMAAIHQGVAAAAAETGALVVGGNLTRAPRLFVSVALVAEAPPRPLCRSGARPGDALYVTGTLGEAALGLRMLRRNPQARGGPVRRFCEPIPRLRAGAVLARSGLASAMIDLSDGLLQDLGHLCAASGVGAEIAAAALPCTRRVRRAGYALALAGGEDYELLCAVPPEHVKRMERLQPELGCRLTRIGWLGRKRDGLRVLDEKGNRLPIGAAGFDHFAGRLRR